MKKYFFSLISVVCVALGVGLYRIADLVSEKYVTSSFEAILFHMRNRVDGTDSSVMWEFLQCLVWPACAVLVLCLLLIALGKRASKAFTPLLIASVLVFLIGAGLGLNKLGFIDYVINKSESSTFIEEHYVRTENNKIIRPEKKRNLIIVYIESMESSYASKEKGGFFDENMIPNLMKIAEENLYFSSTDKYGGTNWVEGTGWTTAGVISTSTGIPVFSPVKDKNDVTSNAFKSVVSLSDVLLADGYYEKFLMGGDYNFGGLSDFVKNHGQVDLVGLNEIKRKGGLTIDDYSGWGFSDRLVLEIAKKDLDSLSKDSSKPFFYSLMTIDTHTPKGFVTSDCDCHFKDDYSKSIECADQHLGSFYAWLRKQSFFENTVVVFMGDHISMNDLYFEGISRNDRRIYNAIVNSAVQTNNNHNRVFNQLDLFPTILAAMGYQIPGERLGLGVNLFSNEPTLYEQFTPVHVVKELQKHSSFYYENIFQ